MNKRQLVALRYGILAIVVAILFPPYGYEKFIQTLDPGAKLMMLGAEIIVSTNNIPWKYVGHSFILSRPPGDDALEKLDRAASGKDVTVFTRPEIKIAWHVLVAEIAVIALLTTSAFLTLGKKQGWRGIPRPGTDRFGNFSN